MATYTSKLQLEMPDSGDQVDVSVFNRNFKKLDDFAKTVFNQIYPVGAIYISTSSTSPATLFGGQWSRISGGVVLVCGNDAAPYKVGTTGGQTTIPYHRHSLASHTHTVNSHTHTLSSHIHKIGAHNHTGPSHTHNYVKATGGTVGSHALSISEMPSHNHGFFCGKGNGTTSGKYIVAFPNSGGAASLNAWSTGFTKTDVVEKTGSTQGHTHGFTISTSTVASTAAGTGNTSSVSLTTGTPYKSDGSDKINATGAAEPATGGPSVANTGYAGTEGQTSNYPPYLAVYVWKRTA